MLKDTLSQTDVLALPMYAFLLFLVTFVGVTARILWRGRKDAKAQALAQLPLAADTETADER